jgi:hypothetical protein
MNRIVETDSDVQFEAGRNQNPKGRCQSDVRGRSVLGVALGIVAVFSVENPWLEKRKEPTASDATLGKRIDWFWEAYGKRMAETYQGD